jgi:Ferritin-like
MSGNVTSDPPAEPVLTVDTRKELVYLLGQACEIEHGVMCEYLYAQFSLKRALDEGLTEAQLARVQVWEKALIGVIKQEMLHLALATNILTAIGAAPHFERPNFPILSRWYPEGVQIALVPFGERALRHFIYLERPEGMALDDAAGFAAARHAQPLTAGGAGLVAEPQEWRTVGHLYRGIEAGLANLCARYGEDAVFIGPVRAQAVTEIFEWPELPAVTGLASAGRAIEIIVEQGEGARRLDQVALRHVRGDPRGPAGRAGGRPGVQPGPAGRAGLRPAAPRRAGRDPDRGPRHRAGRRPGQRPV